MAPHEARALEQFSAKTLTLGAAPKVYVRYEREALMGSFDARTRVTFDRQIRARACRRPSAFFSNESWTAVEPNRVVLELKYDGSCPAWMMDLVRIADLHRISYSKYANSAAATLLNGSVSAHASESP